MRSCGLILVRCWLLPSAVSIAVCAAARADESVDFNRDIRPILAQRCFRCHGPDEEEVKAGLRLDLRERAVMELDGGHSAIDLSTPDESQLLVRVNSTDEDLRMPPAEAGAPLSQRQRDLLRSWIKQGAPYLKHWSLIAPKAAPLPKVSNPDWISNGIDAFVLARLDSEHLLPSPRADRPTLARRLSIDLTGLPPTVEEVDSFVQDQRPDYYSRYVDYLLAKPAYGERWARVWLDQARYADSAGYASDPLRTIWRYRDWVIDAFNKNMPFDQFTIEQIAGDLLPNPSESQILATAFHRNTMTNSEGGTDDEEFRTAAVVDRVNTTMTVWMGTTMACAQCHTHKYDPITQEEYFRFFAVFNNTEDADRADEHPVLTEFSSQEIAERENLEQQIAKLKLKSAERSAKSKSKHAISGPLLTRYIRVELPGKQVYLSLAEVQAFANDKNVALNGKATQVSTGFNGVAHLAIDGNTNGDYFQAKSTTSTQAASDPWWEVELKEPHTLDKVVIWNRTDSGVGKRLKEFRVVGLDERRRPLWMRTSLATPTPDLTLHLPRTSEQLSSIQKSELREYESVTLTSKINRLKKQLADIGGITTPIMRELPINKQRKTHVHIRGNFRQKGTEVTAGVPASLHSLPDDVQANRLTIARWLVDNENPLTARVVVNRYWEQMFGTGIVETTEDFGVSGELPSHPQLLDYLADGLMSHDWDLKWLLREIVTSSTYQQSSRVSEDLVARDPRNRLLARGPRFRLSAEIIRDQALAVSGLLSSKMFGPAVRPPRPNLGLRAAFGELTDWQTSTGEDKYRRGLYTLWRRTTPYPSMTTFDAPSREVCTVRRIRTNTPLQALVTLNDPVFVEAAQALARRMTQEGGDNARSRITYGIKVCLARTPEEAELERLLTLFGRCLVEYRERTEDAQEMATSLLGPAPQDADISELAAYTVVANVLLNLDETLARR